jgi:hypothetical protein
LVRLGFTLGSGHETRLSLRAITIRLVVISLLAVFRAILALVTIVIVGHLAIVML